MTARKSYPYPLNLKEPVELTPLEAELDELDPAWAKFAVYLRTGERFGPLPGNIRARSLHRVALLLQEYRRRVEAGHSLSALSAIALCAEEGVPLPEWLADAFTRRLTAFHRGEGGQVSLDQVFTSPDLPTSGKRAAAARRDRELGGALWAAACQAQQQNPSLSPDAALREVLASRRYGVGLTKARRLVERAAALQSELLGKRQPFSRMKRKTRKP